MARVKQSRPQVDPPRCSEMLDSVTRCADGTVGDSGKCAAHLQMAARKANSLSLQANAYGSDTAARYFFGRKGHGGMVNATRVVLREAKLGAMLALAFEAGHKAAMRGEGF